MAALVYHWKLDEGSGQYAYDEVSSEQLKIYDSAPGDKHVDWDASGYNGACLVGDGYTLANYYAAGDVAAKNTTADSHRVTEFSITFWFKTSVAQDKAMVAHNASDAQDVSGQWSTGIAFSNNAGQSNGRYVPVFWINTEDGTYIAVAPLYPDYDYNYNDDEWHFVAATSSATGNVSKLYIDDCGSEKATLDNGVGGTEGSITQWFWKVCGGKTPVGSWGLGGTFNGKVDDVRIYDGVLTPEEICAIKTDFPSAIANALMFSCNT